MALVSYGFGFFCAVLLLLYYIVPGRFQWRILLAASVLFYGFAGPLWILYPAASSVSVWYLARKIGSMTDQYRNWVQKEQPDRTQKKAYNQRLKARQKRFLILGLLLNFGILAILKYTNFLLSNVEGILHLGRNFRGDGVRRLGPSSGDLLLYLPVHGVSDRCLPEKI